MRFGCLLFVACLSLLVVLLPAADARACGIESDCVIGERLYRIRLPANYDGKEPIGALVFAHGYRGKVTTAVKNKNFAALSKELNIAIIAAKSFADDWSIANAPSQASKRDIDELDYFDRLIDDVSARFTIDRKRIVMTGFSAGGMMVWTLACHRSDRFAAFIPLAGTFWAPVPQSCSSAPANIIHIHGNSDRIVPLEGRKIADTHQGNVHKALSMYTEFGDFGAAEAIRLDDLDCQTRQNADQKLLSFCQFEGGHGFKVAHIRAAWQFLEGAGRL